MSVSGLRTVSLETLKSAYVSLLSDGLSSPTGSIFNSDLQVYQGAA
jgi:hypothetical protein